MMRININLVGGGVRMLRLKYSLLLLVLVSMTGVALAGEAVPARVDAGQTTQENRPAPIAPTAKPGLNIEPPSLLETLPGGDTVVVESLVVEGATIFEQATLVQAAGLEAGRRYDLAGLRGLANLISQYYRDHDYPFAKALVPAQNFEKGALRLYVVEGRFGQVSTSGEAKLIEQAKQFVERLVSGDVIRGSALERSALILSDQPGFKVTPILRPGQQVGTGDLDILLERTERFGGSIGADNYGNRFTGRNRVALDVFANSALTFGDQLRLNTLYSEEDLWLGSLNYSLPVGGSGLRANLGYTHTYYELGKDFASLEANGTARIARANLSYPLLRSQSANLTLVGGYQHKMLNDRNDSVESSDTKFSNGIPLGINFDLRDQFAGGGVTYGSVVYTTGTLHLDSGLRALDRDTAKTDGRFNKLNLDVARVQALPKNLSLFARASGQFAVDNLDSSEKFGLGGIFGVRAFPAGEGFGDEGALAQVELRYTLDRFVPYAFYDIGTVRFNHHRFDGSDNRRTISGAGMGLRYDHPSWVADVTLAWRLSGGDPVSDSKDYQPMAWASMRYKF